MTTPEFIPENTNGVLSRMWEEALDRMSSAAPLDEVTVVIDVTLSTDPHAVARFREWAKEWLAPESVFFLTLSEEVKRHSLQVK